jgi:hypothetical protein
MSRSSRALAVATAIAVVGAITVASLLADPVAVGEYVADADPVALSAFVGLLGILIGAALANALAGPGGPRGPDGPTPADRREDANEWSDPPGVDVDDEN